MSFAEHQTEFAGKRVVPFQHGDSLGDVENAVYSIRIEYESEETITALLSALLEDPAADRLTGLVVGCWSGEIWEDDSSEVVEALVAAAGQLSSLKALFLGDIIGEENEVSWIKQTDLSPLWTAYPQLEHLQIRGSDGLSLGELVHDSLQILTIQCGGLPALVLQQLAQSKLPALEGLQLFLGELDYGFDGSIEDVERLLASEFPKLEYLGLCDSEIADDVAIAVTESPLLEQIKVLDLSYGTLTDTGAQALLDCPLVGRLEQLVIEHHFLSEEMVRRLNALPIETEINDRQEPDEYDGEIFRYIAVGE